VNTSGCPDANTTCCLLGVVTPALADTTVSVPDRSSDDLKLSQQLSDKGEGVPVFDSGIIGDAIIDGPLDGELA